MLLNAITNSWLYEVARGVYRKLGFRRVSRAITNARWKLLGPWRLRRTCARLLQDNAPIRLHVGAGGKRLAGWLNTDIIPKAPVYLDATSPLPIHSNTVTHVFCEHFIEHITYQDALGFVREVFRVLRPEGILRIATPDLEAYAEEYINHSERAERLFARDKDKDYTSYGSSLAALMNKLFYADGHVHLYDYEQLAHILREPGFSEVRRCKVSMSSHMGLSNLEQHSVGTILDDFVLVVEARKSPS